MQKIEPKILTSEKEWLDTRARVVTATEASSLFSLNPYASAAKMLQRKIVPEFQENAYTFTGKVLEPAVIKAVNLLTDRNFRQFESKDEIYFYIHPEHRLGATPDAHFRNTLLECKTTSPKRFAEDWEDCPPLYYILQTHVQMICTGKKQTVLACLPTDLTPKGFNAKFPIHVFFVKYHAVLAELIKHTVDRFWKCVDEELEFEVDRGHARQVKEWLKDSTTRIQI